MTISGSRRRTNVSRFVIGNMFDFEMLSRTLAGRRAVHDPDESGPVSICGKYWTPFVLSHVTLAIGRLDTDRTFVTVGVPGLDALEPSATSSTSIVAVKFVT